MLVNLSVILNETKNNAGETWKYGRLEFFVIIIENNLQLYYVLFNATQDFLNV